MEITIIEEIKGFLRSLILFQVKLLSSLFMSDYKIGSYFLLPILRNV